MHDDRRQRIIDTLTLLSIPGIGRRRFNRLVQHFGSASAVLAASLDSLEALPGISRSQAGTIVGHVPDDSVKEQVARLYQLGCQVWFPDDPGYPALLKEIDGKEIPPVLFAQGRSLADCGAAIGIVGTRHPTEHGRRFAFQLAQDLASAGITVVSGMAEGIDTAAHKGALEAGGSTIAVWGTGLDIVYPAINRELATLIAAQGTVVTEYPPGVFADRSHFPERNRIISGLSEGLVVVEAGTKSGALITAAQAVAQGRELFAVPGAPSAKMSSGTNDLIKAGAGLVTSAEDIFSQLPRLRGKVASRQFAQAPDMTDLERNIITSISEGPQQIDNLSRQMELPVHELMQVLLALELRGVIRELSGKRFVLAEEYA